MKLVIFDLDGTLLDTAPDIADYINETFIKFGVKPCTLEKIKQSMGHGSKELVSDCIGKNVPTEIKMMCYTEFCKRMDNPNYLKTMLFEGISKLLIKLKNDGYKLCILSNKSQSALDKIHDHYLKEFSFDYVIGGGVFPFKPDPTSIRYIMDKFSVSPSNTFLVGDGDTDVYTAINSNVNNISVLWGYRNKSQLQNAGAKVFANNAEEVYKIIKLSGV